MTIFDRHELRAYTAAGEALTVREGGTLTLDDSWTPHVQASLPVAPPADAAAMVPGQRIIIEQYQRFADISATADLTDLYAGTTTATLTTAWAGDTTADITAWMLATAWVSPPRAGTGRRHELTILSNTRTRDGYELDLESIESELVPLLWYAPLSAALTVAAGTLAELARALFAALAAAHFPFVAPSIHLEGTDIPLATTTHEVAVGESLWSVLQQQVTLSQARLYSAGESGLRLTAFPYTLPVTVTVAEAENLIDWNQATRRGAGVLVRFTENPADPAAERVFSSHAFPELNAPHETLQDLAYPFPGYTPGVFYSLITSPAVPYINRATAAAAQMVVTAVSGYHAAPGAAVDLQLPDDPALVGVVDAVTFDLSAPWRMGITVRSLESA